MFLSFFGYIGSTIILNCIVFLLLLAKVTYSIYNINSNPKNMYVFAAVHHLSLIALFDMGCCLPIHTLNLSILDSFHENIVGKMS